MALRKRRMASVDGLIGALSGKFDVASIMGAKADVVNSNSALTVPSTAAINEIVAEFNTQITNISTSLSGIIDDTASTGNSATWSIDKIKAFIASVDDSVVVANLDDRNNIPNPHQSMIAYVIDTTGDTSLGDKEGQAAAYVYVDGKGWQLLQILTQDIDTTPFVKYTDIVNDLTTGGKAVPLSAEQGKELKALVDAAAHATEIYVDNGLKISGNDFNSTYTPVGNVIGGVAEVETSDGVWDVVDVVAGDSPKAWKLLPSTDKEYDGKTCRISYLKYSAES